MSAYVVKNFWVSERAYYHAIELCSDPDLLIRYKNNLAYLIRRKEIRYPKERSKKEIAVLLRDGIERKDTFSLINMALFWALEGSTLDDWEIADHLASFINQNDILDVLHRWQNVSEDEGGEGYLVHFLLLRHGKMAYSPLGDVASLFEKAKKVYPQMPDKMKEIVTPFDGRKMGELPNFVPWLKDDDIEW